MPTALELTLEGQRLESKKNYVQALGKFLQASKLDPTRLDILSGLLRCYERTPDSYFKNEGLAKNWKYTMSMEIESARKKLQETFEDALDTECKILRDSIAASNRRGEIAGLKPSFTPTNDEVRLLAGVRILKRYGFAKAGLAVLHGKCTDLKIESVRQDSSSKT